MSVIYRHETNLCSILIHYTMHVFARKQCILCYALRRKSYLTLPYVTSLRGSFCLRTFAHGFILLPLRSLESSWGCSLAIIRHRPQHGSWEGDCTYIRTSINFAVRNGFTCRLFFEVKRSLELIHYLPAYVLEGISPFQRDNGFSSNFIFWSTRYNIFSK